MGKQAAAVGWSQCQPQAAGLGGNPREVLPLTHSSADTIDRWMTKDWIHNWEGGPGADVGLGCHWEPSEGSLYPPFPCTLAPQIGSLTPH